MSETAIKKQHCLLPCKLRLARLSSVKIISLRSYHRKILIFKGAFNLQRHLLILGASLVLINYKIYYFVEWNQKNKIYPDSCKFQFCCTVYEPVT